MRERERDIHARVPSTHIGIYTCIHLFSLYSYRNINFTTSSVVSSENTVYTERNLLSVSKAIVFYFSHFTNLLFFSIITSSACAHFIIHYY